MDFAEEILKGHYSAVSGLDENIGKMLQELKALELYDDTIIMISADHGDMLGDYGLPGKHIWYEGSVAIPLIIGGGGLTPMCTQELIGGRIKRPRY